MENEPNPQEKIEILTEAECAERLSVARETLSRWRHRKGMPHVPLGEGPKPGIRYVWPDVVAWMRSRSRGRGSPERAKKRGRPRNVDRKNDGSSR